MIVLIIIQWFSNVIHHINKLKEKNHVIFSIDTDKSAE